MSGVVENTENFSSKRLIENPEKTKISTVFELSNKKVMNDIYKKLTELTTTESVNMQELND